MTNPAQHGTTLAYFQALDTLSLRELLDEYNRVSPTGRRAQFKSKAEAINRIAVLLPSRAEDTAAAIVEEATRASAPRTRKRKGKEVRIHQAALVIKILAEINPRREGTDAHRHYEDMRGGITVSQYLDRYPLAERRKARQWLWNTIRDGYAETRKQS
jgi:hypothetical protein